MNEQASFCNVCKLRDGIYLDSVGVECCTHRCYGECAPIRWDRETQSDVMRPEYVQVTR